VVVVVVVVVWRNECTLTSILVSHALSFFGWSMGGASDSDAAGKPM
jgi:hypothetical protein